ncbi:class F sortase [Streptomyces sp. KM273126]|uniref:class F sortase n=1 Tax=Streptomyces sp. KM273126 TaxID=2545247 RepID=UPI00103DCBDB|nr:class F sortase [Streptomyces sp. KM273126]MBA2812347.1 class F sortase [Streptomyces sp. KM273126]
MARRRGAPRPWYRTRAYRLTRTIVVTVCLVVGGVWWAQNDEPADPAGARTDARGVGAPHAPAPRRTPPGASEGAPPRPLPRSRAVSLTVPYLGIEAPLVGLGLDSRRRLTAPPTDDPKAAGWYEGGPAPGQSGTVVLVGHRDTRTGPAVFAALHEIQTGRVVNVRRADGRTAVYTVDAVRTYEKAHFPDEEVYGRRQRPELRLITCGGRYDRRTGYVSNIVVFAHLTATKGPTGST